MDILVKIGQLLLSLSILVILHEFGHFFFAKLFKTRVEKFYLFFDPWFSIFKFKKGETEYGVGWLPLGGYVKISGMIDESMDTEQLQKEPEPWEFRAKPAWQRLLIMLGGVMVNFLLAFVIYVFVLYTWGETYLPTQNARYGVYVEGALAKAGLQNGDQILSVNDQPVNENFDLIKQDILFSKDPVIAIERNGQRDTIHLQVSDIAALIAEKKDGFLIPRVPFIAGSFKEGSLAKAAGMQEGDRLVGINDQKIEFFDEYLAALPNYANQQIALHIVRNEQPLTLNVQLDSTAKIGVGPVKELDKYFDLKVKTYGFGESVPAGISKGVDKVDSYLSQLRVMFTPGTGAYKEIGGFGTIASIFPGTWDWHAFWNLTALLSIMLAVLNVLPIPALDGGHVMFTLYEIIARRKPSEKFLEYAQIAGMVLLFGLIIYANGMDLVRFVFN